MERNSNTILSWPDLERPREKLINAGPAALGPAELLAILLRTGSGRGRNALDIARDIWRKSGESWEGLARLTPHDMEALGGVGPAKAATLSAAIEIAVRMQGAPVESGFVVKDAKVVFEHFRGRLGHCQKELFYALLLDSRNKMVREEKISEGTLTESLVHPREAFRAAIREGAAGLVFVHNHPSGDPTPSKDDDELTKRLFEVSKLIGIRVLDHVIVSRSGYFSYVETS